MGVRQAMVLIGNAGQATSEGKSGLVETGLTGLAATALVCVCVCVCSFKQQKINDSVNYLDTNTHTMYEFFLAGKWKCIQRNFTISTRHKDVHM